MLDKYFKYSHYIIKNLFQIIKYNIINVTLYYIVHYSDLRLSRSRLLELIKNANNSSDTIEPAFHSYLSLVYGFIWEINSAAEQSEHVGRPNPSKLRNVIVYKWTHTLLGSST